MSTGDYKPTIGIETHVQLKTKSKLFSAVANDARSAPPNSLISHIDSGLPGALPVLNSAAVELACRAALALNAVPQKFSKFDRKHYFYPDLPKGYQITQWEDPIIKGGWVALDVNGQKKRINIARIHLEEDAGKNIHPAGADYSLVDLNRAGTPLIEIVSQPQINSPAEAKAYVRELYLLMKYADVSDVDLYHGNMRFDVNISVSQDDQRLGRRTEIKNLNSFRSVENAVAYEIKRQTELYKKGEKVIQETRGWDEAKQKTAAQRGKEEAHDYRYMPEPDIPPVELDQIFINTIKAKMPKLPNDIRQILGLLDISASVIEDILERRWLCNSVLAQIQKGDQASAKRLAFWWQRAQPRSDNEPNPGREETTVDAGYVVRLSEMVDKGQLNSNAAQAVFNEMLFSSKSPDEIAEAQNLIQLSDEPQIDKIVAAVLRQNPQAAQDIKNGQLKAVGFLVGQVMAQTHGKANPQLAQNKIKKQLGI